MNNISRKEVKLVDCYPEIQRKTLRQQEADGFWEGQEHAGKEDVLVYAGEEFCCFFKTMPSSQLRQASRATSRRSFTVIETTDLNFGMTNPRCTSIIALSSGVNIVYNIPREFDALQIHGIIRKIPNMPF